ncbi:hypothetical protein BU17DRAFT_80326 [Hysterangium stoloniferum]|nr:hypothetical protein BU17DRAFT_80326 [Hysterangium stoloniferum]
MNRLVSVFQTRTRRESRPPPLNVITTNDSPSSSSDGSAPTPDDDPDTRARPRSMNSLPAWLKAKSTKSSVSAPPSKPPLPKPVHVATIWPPLNPPVLQVHVDSDEDEDSSDHYDEDEDHDDQSTQPIQPHSLTRSQSSPPNPPLPPPPPLQQLRSSSHSPHRSSVKTPTDIPQSNLRALTHSALNQRPPASPFLHAPATPLFPRSSNPSRSLPVVQTTRIITHKSIIMRRIESKSLTLAEIESIAPFLHRRKHNHNHPKPPQSLRRIDDDDVSDLNAKKVVDCSPGVRRWLDRPCFEQRAVLWLWDSSRHNFVYKPIAGSDKAVAALEFSEGLEAMAASSSNPPGYTQKRLTPLRIHPAPPPELYSSSSSNVSQGPLTPITVSTPSTFPRHSKIRGVIDDDDDMPLSFHSGVIERKEQEERERRQRMQAMLAQEVAAARERREEARMGKTKEVIDDSMRSFTRPQYDRRGGSEPGGLPGGDSWTSTTRRAASETDQKGSSGAASIHNVSGSRLPESTAAAAADDRRRRRGSGTSSQSTAAPSLIPAVPVIPPLMSPMYMSPTPLPVPQYFVPPPFPPHPTPAPVLPISSGAYFLPLVPPTPVRPGLPVSRSAEGLSGGPRSVGGGRNRAAAARRQTFGPEEMARVSVGVSAMGSASVSGRADRRERESEKKASVRGEPSAPSREDANAKRSDDPRRSSRVTDDARRPTHPRRSATDDPRRSSRVAPPTTPETSRRPSGSVTPEKHRFAPSASTADGRRHSASTSGDDSRRQLSGTIPPASYRVAAVRAVR